MLATTVLMSEGEARACLSRIKTHWLDFWTEIKRFHDGQGWKALGHPTFEACVDAELGMTRQQAYRLLWAGEVQADLDCNHVVTTQATPRKLEELHQLPAPIRVDVARQVDFSQTSVRELRVIVKTAKAELDAKVEAQRALAPPKALPDPQPVPNGIVLDVADAGALPLPDMIADLVVTSPPYGLGKDYGTEDDPLKWLLKVRRWLREMHRVTREHGRLAINVPLDTTAGGFRPTYMQVVRLAVKAGWVYRSSIVWNEGNVTHSIGRGSVDSCQAPHVIAPVEMVALFSKGEWKRESPNGHVSDLGHDEWLEWTNGLWTFGGEGRAWEGHPAPFPEELPRRLIKLLSFPGDTILDPFLGSGTTAVVAYRLGRKCYGFDISSEYVASARRRLAAERI